MNHFNMANMTEDDLQSYLQQMTSEMQRRQQRQTHHVQPQDNVPMYAVDPHPPLPQFNDFVPRQTGHESQPHPINTDFADWQPPDLFHQLGEGGEGLVELATTGPAAEPTSSKGKSKGHPTSDSEPEPDPLDDNKEDQEDDSLSNVGDEEPVTPKRTKTRSTHVQVFEGLVPESPRRKSLRRKMRRTAIKGWKEGETWRSASDMTRFSAMKTILDDFPEVDNKEGRAVVKTLFQKRLQQAKSRGKTLDDYATPTTTSPKSKKPRNTSKKTKAQVKSSGPIASGSGLQSSSTGSEGPPSALKSKAVSRTISDSTNRAVQVAKVTKRKPAVKIPGTASSKAAAQREPSPDGPPLPKRSKPTQNENDHSTTSLASTTPTLTLAATPSVSPLSGSFSSSSDFSSYHTPPPSGPHFGRAIFPGAFGAMHVGPALDSPSFIPETPEYFDYSPDFPLAPFPPPHQTPLRGTAEPNIPSKHAARASWAAASSAQAGPSASSQHMQHSAYRTDASSSRAPPNTVFNYQTGPGATAQNAHTANLSFFRSNHSMINPIPSFSEPLHLDQAYSHATSVPQESPAQYANNASNANIRSAVNVPANRTPVPQPSVTRTTAEISGQQPAGTRLTSGSVGNDSGSVSARPPVTSSSVPKKAPRGLKLVVKPPPGRTLTEEPVPKEKRSKASAATRSKPKGSAKAAPAKAASSKPATSSTRTTRANSKAAKQEAIDTMSLDDSD